MKIELTTEQRHRLKEWAKDATAAQVEAGVEPTGFVIVLEVEPVFGSHMRVERNGVVLDLGEVEVTLDD